MSLATTPENDSKKRSAVAHVADKLGLATLGLDAIGKFFTTLTTVGAAIVVFSSQGSVQLIAAGVALAALAVLVAVVYHSTRGTSTTRPGVAVRPAFRGRLAFDVGEPLFERKGPLDLLFARTTARDARINILHGDSASGKTSLLLAGLVTALKRDAQWLPVYVAQPPYFERPNWAPDVEIAEELLTPDVASAETTIGGALATALTRAPDRTIVIIYDQFEQFFLANPKPEARASFLNWVADCVHDDDLAVRFVFSIRSGFEPCIDELQQTIGWPVSAERRTPVPRFQPAQARRVLDGLVALDNLPFSSKLRAAVVHDLTKSGDVCPADLQIIGKWLAERGITTLGAYELVGRADALFCEFLSEVAQVDRLTSLDMPKDILLALSPPWAATGQARVAMSRAELLQAVGHAEASESESAEHADRFVRDPFDRALAHLIMSGLVNETVDHHYELVHEYFRKYIRDTLAPRKHTGRRVIRIARAMAAGYGRAALVGVLATLALTTMAACTLAETKASKVVTLQPPATQSSSRPFAAFGVGGELFAVGDNAAPTSFRVQMWDVPLQQALTPLPNADLRTPETQRISVQRWAEKQYAVVFIGQAEHPEAQAALRNAGDRVRLVQTQAEAAQVDVPDAEGVAYLTQTTLSRADSDAVVTVLKERFPVVVNADRPQFVPLGLEFSRDEHALRLVTVSAFSDRWAVWEWDLLDRQRPPTYRTGELGGTDPDCPPERASVSQAGAEQTRIAIGYKCGPIRLLKTEAGSVSRPTTVGRHVQDSGCTNEQLMFSPGGDRLFALYLCQRPDQPPMFKLRPWLTTEEQTFGGPTDPASIGEWVLRATPQEAIDLKFEDDPMIRGVTVGANEELRAVVRAGDSIELREVGKARRLSWLNVGQLGDASPSPDGRFVVRIARTSGSLTQYELYEMGAWIETGTALGTIRLWSWLEGARELVQPRFTK